MLMFVPVPDTPEVEVMFTPGIFPCNTRPTSAWGRSSMFFLSMDVTEYPKARFSRTMPWAVTTTSLSCLVSAVSTTSIAVRLPTVISWVVVPTKLTTSIAPAGAEIEYPPSESVFVPLVVPFTTTDAPGIEEPSSPEVTFPVTLRSCAAKLANAKQLNKMQNSILFIRINLV